MIAMVLVLRKTNSAVSESGLTANAMSVKRE